MIGLVSIWSHVAAALLFAALAAWQMQRPEGGMRRRTFALALAATALWAVAAALAGPESAIGRFMENGRNLAWLGLMLTLLLRGQPDERRPAIFTVYAVLGAVLVVLTVLDLVPAQAEQNARVQEAFLVAGVMLRMMVAVGSLLLIHNLYTAAAPDARWGIRLPMIALAAMWTYDLNLYTIAYLSGGWPEGLLAGRGIAMAMLAPLFALASQRNDQWRMKLSRAATFQSLSLLAMGGYLVVMVIIARALQLAGGDYAQLGQISVVFGMTVIALVLMPSKKLRGWLRVKVAKHLFQHRYDYRVEWMRFTETLGRPGAAALDERVVQAIADITESPGGLLLLADHSGGLASGTRWRWRSLEPPPCGGDAAFAGHLAATGRIIELDAIRSGRDAEVAPRWMLEDPRAWVAVPLVHFGRLVGMVLLERPPVGRTLDWEDFDLLRAAGRQVASYLAEAKGQEALSEAKRFDEFNRRFAFIMHDIKNLVSQLSLVARNAERHADNPQFRADMIATLQSSVGKMNDLLARLSQHDRGKSEEPRPVAVKALIEAAAAPKRDVHPVRVDGRGDLIALADPVRLEQAVGHLIQNAIDASPGGEAVCVTIGRCGLEAAIEILDRGCGMSAEFIRTRLFKPFASTKEGGFGVGAFEARSLVAAMGGRLEVESHEGEGSCFTILLPLTQALRSVETAKPNPSAQAEPVEAGLFTLRQAPLDAACGVARDRQGERT
jgi:putative PEP-CTERM system histidine kinase